ncbi:Rpa14 [Kluyveromyces lactis]|nr:Rpa14 [Kluyveromyces lactis]
MLRGTRRPANSTLNTPVVVHTVGTPTYLSKDEVLQFLASFIAEKESVPGVTLASNEASTTQGAVTSGGISADEMALDTQLSSALAQLKRVERDFKGLPPQVMEMEPSSTSSAGNAVEDTVAKSATGGKKIKFADVPEPSQTSSDSKQASSSSESSSDSE